MIHYKIFKPGAFEVYYGSMKSGKTKALLDRVEQLTYTNHNVLVFKPEVDTRDGFLKSRNSANEYSCIYVNERLPESIFDHVKENTSVVAIDEIQFFSKNIAQVVEALQRRNINIIAAGLNTDFRGEPFGAMGHLLALANESYALAGVCDVSNCNMVATRTQRLIDGKPAQYDSPIILIEGSGKEVYETRCLHHHDVPGKPE